ncbi:MAG: N-formylglutamate amidohydrolase [Pseudomonadota bacterium]
MPAPQPTSPNFAPLLAADEPPAVELFNAAGRADALVVCDHAERRVPRTLGALGLPPWAFDRHIAWDIGAAEVARRLALALDAPLVLAGYSRLVIDPNRRPGDPTSIPEQSDGVPVPGNLGLGAAARGAREAALFHPYHDAIRERIEAIGRRGAVPAVVSIHSCTPVFEGFERPWHLGVLWNRDPRLPVPLLERLAAEPGIVVGDNQPYSARQGRGYTMARHAESAGLPHVLIELRQDLVDTRHGAERLAAILAAALRKLLADPALHRVERHWHGP